MKGNVFRKMFHGQGGAMKGKGFGKGDLKKCVCLSVGWSFSRAFFRTTISSLIDLTWDTLCENRSCMACFPDMRVGLP